MQRSYSSASSVLRFFAGLTVVLGLCSRAQALTWTGDGSGDNWTDADNWGGTAPVGGESLVFSGTGDRCTNVNDLAADLSFAGLTFDSGPRTYLLSGSRIALGGTVLNSSTNTHRINFDMVLDATRTFNVANGNLFLNGTLSGAGGVTQSGGTAKVLVLKGTNTYQGVTTVSGSILRIESDQALGSTDSGTVVGSIPNDNKMLHLANVNVTGEAVTLYGKGDNNGALQSVAGSNTWGGKVILGAAGENRLGNSAATGMLVVSGVIEGPAGNHMTVRNKDDSGPTVLANTNAYLGETQVIVGTLRLSGGDDRLPTNTVVNVGNGSNVNWALLDLNGCNQTVGGLTQAGSTMPRKVTNLASNKVATLTANLYKPYTYSASFDGYLNLVKSGPSNLTLSAANYHYGQTVVREGALILNGPSALQDSTLNTGDGPMGVLAFGTNTMISFGGLVGTNDLVMTNRFGAAMQLRIRGSQSTTYDGQILVGSDFTKTGSGLFTMNNTNLYTGRTTLAGGTLRVLSEDSFGAYPESYVADQIIFDGGTFRTETNFVLAANNRGVSLAAGGGTLWTGNRDAVLTVDKLLTGPGGLDAKGKGVTLLSVSNAYDGVTTVGSALSEEPCVLRVLNKDSLGSSAAGAVVTTGSQLELANGLTVSEGVTINGAGNTVEPPPPSSPSSNRGALQAAAGATAEWAGPMLLGSNQARLGAQNNGHLIVSGVIDDGAASYALRISTNPGDRTRGVEFRAHNTYNGSTDLTRGMLFLGISDAISPTSILDVHWASSNNSELSGLDTKGFDQTVAGLKNSGITGANALITNSSLTVSTLTVSQSVDTVYSGTIRGPIALVKDGAGSLTLGFPTYYSGLTTVRGGTLALGASGVIPSGNAILLSGGTFDVSGTTNTFASLTVTSDSTLNIGAGMLSFTVQTADAWLGQLTLTGELGTTSLRFQPLLTVSQLDSIRYEGKRVMQNSNGYLVPWFGTLLQMY